MNTVEDLVEPDILEQIDDLSEVSVNPEQRLNLTHNRFDLAFKLFYLQGLDIGACSPYREACYKQHIKAFSGRFAEPNNPDKNTYDKFRQVFEELFFGIKEHGFDTGKSLIPLAANGSILNGAHRTSIAIFLKSPVGTVQTPLPAPPFDYHFFKERGVHGSMLDTAAQTFCEYDDHCFLAAVWPAAKGHDAEIESVLGQVVYKKVIRLTLNGAHNLLAEAYQDEPWLGPASENLPGVQSKLAACFPVLGNVRIFLFRADCLEQVEAKKKTIREIFNIGNHAIHITNNQEETTRLGALLFNSNGIHFLNHGYPRRLSQTMVTRITDQFSKQTTDKIDVVLNDDLILSMYGVRRSGREEWPGRPDPETLHEPGAGSANKLYSSLDKNWADNPGNVFVYKGIKFISLKQIYLMKMARRSGSDIADIKLIRSMVNDNKFEETTGLILSFLYYKKFLFVVKLRQFTSRFLKKAGLLTIVKKILR